MLSIVKSGILGLGFAMGLLLSGCQSADSGPHSTAVAATQAVRCDQCKITWVQVPSSGGTHGQVVVYSDRKQMECPGCRDAVASFFTTGKFQHTCSFCGGNLTACETH